MNSWRNEDRLKQVLKLLANPLTIRILSLLVGLDSGHPSKEELCWLQSNSWDVLDKDGLEQTRYGGY